MAHVKNKVLAPGQEIYFAKVEFLFTYSMTATTRVIVGPMPIVEVSKVYTHGGVNPANIKYNTVQGRHPATQCFTSLAAAKRYIDKTVADRQEELARNEREKVVVT